MKKFRGKYRIKSTRAYWWNYAKEGDYLITINCYRHKRFLDRIKKEPNTQMILSQIREITKNEWIKTAELRPDMNLVLGPYQCVTGPAGGPGLYAEIITKLICKAEMLW